MSGRRAARQRPADKRDSALEQLAAARSGAVRATSQALASDSDDGDADIYDELDEEEYAKKYGDKGSFVEDDDGMGYDDGGDFHHEDEESDEASGSDGSAGSDGGSRPTKRAKAGPKKTGALNVRQRARRSNYKGTERLQTSSFFAGGTKSAGSSSAAVAGGGGLSSAIDSLLGDDAGASSASKSSSRSRGTAGKRKRLSKGGSSHATASPVGRRQARKVRETVKHPVSMKREDSSSGAESPPPVEAAEESKPAVTPVGPDGDTQMKESADPTSLADKTIQADAMTEATETVLDDWRSGQTDVPATSSPQAPVSTSDKTLDASEDLYFYWIDATEERGSPGCVFLFGRLFQPATKQYESICVIVRNMTRQLLVVPRPDRVRCSFSFFSLSLSFSCIPFARACC
jgi:DNA polymerase alpha subunit p180 N terminal